MFKIGDEVNIKTFNIKGRIIDIRKSKIKIQAFDVSLGFFTVNENQIELI